MVIALFCFLLASSVLNVDRVKDLCQPMLQYSSSQALGGFHLEV